MYCKASQLPPHSASSHKLTKLNNVANDTHNQETHAYCLADLCELSSVGWMAR